VLVKQTRESIELIRLTLVEDDVCLTLNVVLKLFGDLILQEIGTVKESF
jgi:hypothetical protein